MVNPSQLVNKIGMIGVVFRPPGSVMTYVILDPNTTFVGITTLVVELFTSAN